jgi:hypothetical protein
VFTGRRAAWSDGINRAAVVPAGVFQSGKTWSVWAERSSGMEVVDYGNCPVYTGPAGRAR